MRLFALLALLLLLPLAALAQPCVPPVACAPSGPLDTISTRAAIYHMLEWDEGQGPALYIAGQFRLMPQNTSTAIAFVARYKDGRWDPLGAGLPNTTGFNVRALAVQDFSSVGGPGPSLYAGGDGGSIYRWNGSAWVFAGSNPGGVCYTLLAHQDASGPLLLAGGNYSGAVLAWRGSGNWTPYGLFGSGIPKSLRVVDDGSGPALFMAGSINDASRNIRGIAKLVNGQWTAFPTPFTTVQSISDITTFDTGQGPELYLCGTFSQTSPQLSNVARRRNGMWEPIGNGIVVADPTIGPTFFKINEGSGDRLYLGGTINRAPDHEGLVRLSPDGASWETPIFLARPVGAAGPTSGSVHAMIRFNDTDGPATFVGGIFSSFTSTHLSFATTSAAFGLIRTDASAPTGFRSTASGLGEPRDSQFNNAKYVLSPIELTPGDTRLLASGYFLRAGGLPTAGASFFDGEHWTPTTAPNENLNSALQQGTMATINGQRRLFAAAMGSLGPVASWNGTQWSRFIPSPPGGNGLNIFEFQSSLYAYTELGLSRYDPAMNFWNMVTSSSGNTCAIMGDLGSGPRILMAMNSNQGPGIYAYDGATSTRIGPILGAPVTAIAVHDEGAGPTIFIGSSSMPGYIYRLVNGAWQQLGTGLSIAGSSPIAMASFNDGHGPALYVAGPFNNAGGVSQLYGLARWRNGAWSRVIEPAPGAIVATQGINRTSFAVFRGQLYLAGDFTNLAHLNADHLAVIARCPFSCTSDYNQDGDSGTDQDIEAFFACIGGTCCPTCTSDFNNDGDAGTDQDIESFFRVLGGGPC